MAFKLSNEANLPKLTQSMMALKDSCVRNGTPYVRSIVGGKQTSPEGHCAGMQVVFIVEFEVSLAWVVCGRRWECVVSVWLDCGVAGLERTDSRTRTTPTITSMTAPRTMRSRYVHPEGVLTTRNPSLFWVLPASQCLTLQAASFRVLFRKDQLRESRQ